jgi:hypothetical protein
LISSDAERSYRNRFPIPPADSMRPPNLSRFRAVFGLVLILLGGSCRDAAITPVQPRIGPPAGEHALALSGTLDGEHFRIEGQPGVFLSFGGRYYAYRDFEALQACTGTESGIMRMLASMPALPYGGTLPALGTRSGPRYEWMSGQRPVRAAGDSTLYVVLGCVKSAFQSAAHFEQVFGTIGWSRIVEEPAEVLAALPTGHPAPAPLRRAGTLIRAQGQPEVRWVTHAGGSFGIPSEAVFHSYCRHFSEVVEVSAEEFARYPMQGVLPLAQLPCTPAPPPLPVLADGQLYRVQGDPTVWKAFGGRRYGMPSWETLLVCTNYYPGQVRVLAQEPGLGDGPVLPNAAEPGAVPWMLGQVPVRARGGSTVYVVNGCVKSGFSSEAAFEEVFGHRDWSRVREIDAQLLERIPEGPLARHPYRAAGTLLRAPSGALKWVLHTGGALQVEERLLLAGYCFRSGAVPVEQEEFDAYAARATLGEHTLGCEGLPPVEWIEIHAPANSVQVADAARYQTLRRQRDAAAQSDDVVDEQRYECRDG